MVFFRRSSVGSQADPGLASFWQESQDPALRWQSSLTPSCCSLSSRVGFMTLIHSCDSEFFDVSWVNCTHMNGNLRVCCSQCLGRVMVRRSLAEDLIEGWELSVYSTALIFIFPLPNCFSQSGYRWSGRVVNYCSRLITATIKPCSSSSLCFWVANFEMLMSHYSSYLLQTAGEIQQRTGTGLEEHIQTWPSQLLFY